MLARYLNLALGLLALAHAAHAIKLNAKTNAPKTTVSAKTAAHDVCVRMNDQERENLAEPFRQEALTNLASGEWYACSGPADAPELTCFLAPSWMGLEDGKWICTNMEAINRPAYNEDEAENSY
jgi:hypothetical protein